MAPRGRRSRQGGAIPAGETSLVPVTLSVVIPVYNEARTIAAVVDRVLKAPVGVTKDLVIVDDASTDGTRQVLRDLHAP